MAKATRNNRAAFCIVPPHDFKCVELFMPISTIVVIVLILVLIGAVPAWPHSRSWGYGPSGILGVVLVVVLVLLLMGRL